MSAMSYWMVMNLHVHRAIIITVYIMNSTSFTLFKHISQCHSCIIILSRYRHRGFFSLSHCVNSSLDMVSGFYVFHIGILIFLNSIMVGTPIVFQYDK